MTNTPPSATAAGVVHAHARGRWTGRTVEIEGWVDPALPVSVTDEIGRQVAAARAITAATLKLLPELRRCALGRVDSSVA